mgnify:CR=1 FL=1
MELLYIFYLEELVTWSQLDARVDEKYGLQLDSHLLIKTVYYGREAYFLNS